MTGCNEAIRTKDDKQPFEVQFTSGDHLKGETLGYIEDEKGLYLYPSQESGQFHYSFIPAGAISEYEIVPRLGEVLVEEGVVINEELEHALDEQEHGRHRQIGDYLRNETLATQQDVLEALQTQQSFPGEYKLGQLLV